MGTLIELGVPLLIGAITVPLYGQIKRLGRYLSMGVGGKLPPIAHRALVVGVAGGLTWASGQLGVALPVDLSMWTPASTEMFLGGIAAIAMHAGNKTRDA